MRITKPTAMRPNSVHSRLTFYLLLPLCIVFSHLFFLESGKCSESVIVTAEGLADPSADTYKRDKVLLLDALLDDAKRQAIEKVVGIYVEGQSLVENYILIQDRVLSRTNGLIKKIHKQSQPWVGKDGFMHILIKAEVYSQQTQDALQEMSRAERVNLIRDFGNPKIAVAVTIRDSNRSSRVVSERSQIAENILKEHISRFGYRVWSEEIGKEISVANAEKSMVSGQSDLATYYSHRRGSDFIIRGEAKFRPISIKLKASQIEINKFQLTSWTVKCIDNRTGEEIYFNNKVPTRMSWNTEDAALAAIGQLMGEEFSKDFFDSQMLQDSRIYQVEILGLPSYDAGVLFKKELIGLRPILNVDFRSFESLTGALFEIEFSGNELKFPELLNSTVIGSLNAKFNEKAFQLQAVEGTTVKILFKGSRNEEKVLETFQEKPPSSFAFATPERLANIALSEASLEKIGEINPEAVASVIEYQKIGKTPASNTTINAIKDF